MKTFLISLLALLLVVLISGPATVFASSVFILFALIFIYPPMIIIEAYVLGWLFTDFNYDDSLMVSFLINFVSFVFFIFIITCKIVGHYLDLMVNSGYEIGVLIGIVVINIFIQLLVLKLEYKAVISIRGVIGIAFAHIAVIGLIKYLH